MGQQTVYYYHALSSPWAYLGWPEFKALIEKHDLNVIVRPTRIVPDNGGVPLRSRPQPRQDYHAVELDRWRKRLNMPLVLKPKHYPTNNEFSARMVIAANTLGLPALELSHGLLRALWSEEQDVTLPEVRIAVADALGLDGKTLQAMEEAPDVVQAWHDSHEEARRRGVFGTPTWIYNDVLYWGQDRLNFLDEALCES
ncbi:2-hydroxychromene-2-carboxylate isomerase [Agrobacterium rubi]|uniref:2-hydroxychromene-2-carboxylate isomerase n=1 Tax=Agrobacterium rubi TaxID=28099 RepID=A0AAE7R8X8_9HYPH|nr:DsbA family protein [Agrobacterium rubi]NTE88118.1 2-hydroxychromene-2-carboxylate isomerase [Agrobacterium rubi]NTF03885.1 2-hydroxychromene-2-carboxylate isomerase [Agrobacterium rubi]NTF38212.1 2-hydroxychromene-2-carboxylate isomerase [Agrobacterium rubi]OCJ43709.1 2-hydroxychromene-2-carboxylate isomerase [Agrobacterium rubi]QTG01892.1 2-hydroxychromene-2-carboxylate isomerase [Agrobacterium rubi]